MKIVLLDLAEHPLPLLAGVESAGARIRAWLAPALPEAEFHIHSLNARGEWPPEAGDFDGLLLGGSEAGVYDDLPWMAPVRTLLLAARASSKPVYGICFGHQIMADTFGGKAEKALCGNHVGARRFTVDGRALDALVWHQDQVTAVPPDATVTGSAAHCPVGALAYRFPAASVQFHPEFTATYLSALTERYLNVSLTPDVRSEALRTAAAARLEPVTTAETAAHFFREHLR